jgi:holin-like protein
MIRGIAALLACQLAGEVLARALGVPVPGPVLGIVLLLAGLASFQRLTGRDAIEDNTLGIAATSDGFLKHLSLLFVPAGVGITALLPSLGSAAMPLATALVVSTVVTLATTVWVFVFVARRIGRKP